MQFILLIEFSSIDVSFIFPLQNSISSRSIMEISIEIIILSYLQALTFKVIVFETSSIFEILRVKMAIVCFSRVVHKISLIIGAICKNVSSFSMSFSILEKSNIERSIYFVHFSKPIWF